MKVQVTRTFNFTDVETMGAALLGGEPYSVRMPSIKRKALKGDLEALVDAVVVEQKERFTEAFSKAASEFIAGGAVQAAEEPAKAEKDGEAS